MLNLQPPYEDLPDPPDHMATQAEADREFVANVAFERRDQAWILSDRDVWYANPCYRGPKVPHPESLEAEFGEDSYTVPDGFGGFIRTAQPAPTDAAGEVVPDDVNGAGGDDQSDIPF